MKHYFIRFRLLILLFIAVSTILYAKRERLQNYSYSRNSAYASPDSPERVNTGDKFSNSKMAPEKRTSFFEKKFLYPRHIFQSTAKSTSSETRSVSLKQVVQLGLANNLDIEIENIAIDVEEGRVSQEKGVFDPVIEASADYETSRRPQNAQEFVSTDGTQEEIATGRPRIFEQDVESYSLKVKGKVKTGLQYELSTEANVNRSTLTRESQSSLFNPEYGSFTGLTLTQPLLKDAGTDANTARIRIVSKDKDIAGHRLTFKVMEVTSGVIEAYHNFNFSKNEVNIYQSAVDAIKSYVKQTEINVEKGISSRRQLATARSKQIETEDLLITAEQKYDQSRYELYQFLGSEFDPANSIPSSDFSHDIPEFEFNTLLEHSRMNHPDIMVAEEQIEKGKWEMIEARNEHKIQFDITGSAGARGLDHTFHEAYDRPYNDNTFNYSIGLVISRPWNRTQAKGKIQEVQNKQKQYELNHIKKSHEVATNIKLSLSNLETQKSRYKRSKEFREYMESEIDEEELLLEKGEKAIYEILELYKSLYESRVRELSSLRDLNQAKFDVWYYASTLLDELGIEVEEVL